jgi:outer membrane protein TolC
MTIRFALFAGAMACALTLLTPRALSAAEERAAPVASSPVIQFPEDGISLLEAVRLTLEHDPDLEIERAQTDFAEGVLLERAGAFDAVIRGSLSYEYQLQELTESRKQIERDKRQALEDLISDNRDKADEAQELLDALEDAQSGGPGSTTLPDSELNAELLVIDTLIAQTADPVARQELEDVRDEFLDSAIDNTQTGLQTALDEFQEAQQLRRQLGETPQDEELFTGAISLELDKLFRNGVRLTPFLEGSVEGDNFKDKPTDPEFGGKGIEDFYIFRFGANARIPLMRGAGSDATGALERSAAIEQEASRALLRHRASASVLRTLLAYWDVRAANELVDVTRASVERQERIVEATERLINDGELPAVEIARVEASRARSKARLENARRQLHEARVNLATVIGLAAGESAASIPTARDEFPEIPEERLRDPNLSALMSLAEEGRQDVAAARRFEDSGRVLLRKAETDLLARLDLVGGVWTTALGEGQLSDAVDRWVGPSFKLGLQYEKPLANNVFRGRFAQRRAELRQQVIEASDLERSIRLRIVRLVESLVIAAQRVQQAQQAVRYYDQTIESELTRFRDGESTLIDTILTEDQQTSALSELVRSRQAFAKLLAQLRFETATLVEHGPDESVVSREDLLSLPGRL